MPSSILLRGGTVLTHDENDHVVSLVDTDILIDNDTISKIGRQIPISPDQTVEVIDCKGKIVSPGFIDTHHHLWQTQLKGRHADHGLVEYMVKGYMMGYTYSPADTYWGQLSGCLEAINSGTTTVLDHAHIAYSAEHANSALNATIDSGLRSIFAGQVPVRLSHWDEKTCDINTEFLPEWSLDQLSELASKHNRDPKSRVEVGLGFDAWFLPKDLVLGAFQKLKGNGVRLVTSHVTRNAFFGLQSTIPLMDSYGLLREPYSEDAGDGKTLPFLHLSHCNNIPEEDLKRLVATGTPVSSTPDTEAQMALGHPVALHLAFRSATTTSNAGLGIDCHTNNPSSILLQARTLLNVARAQHNDLLLKEDKFPVADVLSSTEKVFNLATIRGARSLGIHNKVGSILEGKKADLVIFDAENSVGMLSATEFDPLVSVVRFSEAADIEFVIVDGKVRKRNGKLVDVESSVNQNEDSTALKWSDVAKKVRESQKEIQERIKLLNTDVGRESLLKAFHVDETRLVDGAV
ncbi:hypothetical protein LTR84_012663 [Exophiala bonariae]|uniref:Amidohydrolase-related domain-containing protein n=1 Tax=Exophiala bonariae TaxID=1690606 RepID=A0AAV9NEM6_9EURO|nr:hypothetical protein LTR84_012663 [Exophiala bonariae]